MKSETNTGIKSYRNAEVNGMEHNPCKNVEVLGNKGPLRSYMIKCEMCICKNLKKKSHNLCVSTERLLADEEQRPSYSLFAFPLFFYFFSIFFFL